MTDEEVEVLWRNMSQASQKITGGAAYKAGQGNENAYAIAYRRLQRAGLVYPLKRKYTST